jgi:hypothetical protein
MLLNNELVNCHRIGPVQLAEITLFNVHKCCMCEKLHIEHIINKTLDKNYVFMQTFTRAVAEKCTLGWKHRTNSLTVQKYVDYITHSFRPFSVHFYFQTLRVVWEKIDICDILATLALFNSDRLIDCGFYSKWLKQWWPQNNYDDVGKSFNSSRKKLSNTHNVLLGASQ